MVGHPQSTVIPTLSLSRTFKLPPFPLSSPHCSHPLTILVVGHLLMPTSPAIGIRAKEESRLPAGGARGRSTTILEAAAHAQLDETSKGKDDELEESFT
ncbi:hypothetical protein Syun_025407 [Stephania yunnanensis]|uniref:Uncharacterized protein n=1 Tax=Stephania yunnanensis TaxID=152371 RepID=A0AAP0EUJ0_9MAGN